MENQNQANRLIHEQSPYLLQHAYNPVDWHPWREDAFKKAKEEDKPIFLSIGYSTCHWCHVMERESFEHQEVAQALNSQFIAIKVDREELPDIDSYYMTVCQLLTGSGGWPLTIVMTPEKEPFFAATYIPRESRGGRSGMLELLPALHAVWTDRRGDVSSSVSSIMDALKSAVTPSPGGSKLSGETHRKAFAYFRDKFDRIHGGFGTAQKFPSAHNLIFLLRYWHRTGDREALEMVNTTLTHMKNGGIYDHVGFGFHRYSTDPAWHLPHFEKMLYDQAMISWAYLEAFEATGDESFGDAASEIFAYVLRDLQSPDGGFYTAEDADSEGEEGLFYLWSAARLEDILGEDYPVVAAAFGITPVGNYAEEAGGQKAGLNLFDRSGSPLPAHWNELREKLFAAREQRAHPLKDDKILADWNGLMISALSKAARILKDSKHLHAAQEAADFVLGHMVDKNGRLLHRYREGQAAVPGYLDDYAFFIQGLIDLYEASFEAAYLREAMRLTDEMITLFFDEDNGGFYSSAAGNSSLPFRQKESVDSALPSGNSAAFGNLLRLSWLTGNSSYLDNALASGSAFSSLLEQYPHGHAMMLAWHELLLSEPVEVIIVGDPDANDTRAMVTALTTIYSPESVVLLKTAGRASRDGGTSGAGDSGASDTPLSTLDDVVPFARDYSMVDGKATAYVCRNFTCNLPTTGVDEMISQLRGNG